MQNHYNLIYREEEREMVPTLKVGDHPTIWQPTAPSAQPLLNPSLFSQLFGVGSIPWSPLARGALTRPLGERTIRADNDMCAVCFSD